MQKYLQQAKDFLNTTNTQLDIIAVPEAIAQAPMWSTGDHGRHYKIKLTRGGETYMFDFWGSIADKQDNKRPTIYDVLTCLDTYSDNYDTLSEFMQEFGYEVSQLELAEKTFKAIKEQTRELKKLYSQSELDQLAEIA